MSKKRRMDYDVTQEYNSPGPLVKSTGRRSRVRRTFRKQRKLRIRTITPYNTPYTFERNVEWDLFLNLASGWNGRGPTFALTWSLTSMQITMTDGLVYGPSIPGASDLSNLFDQWRIDRVDIVPIFSATNHQVVASSTNTLVQPVILMVTDYDNNGTTDNLLEFPQVRTVQLGTTNGKLLKHVIMKPGVVAAMETPTGSTLGGVKRSPWIDTATPDVVHYAFKCTYQQFNPVDIDYNPALTVGCLKLMCKIYYTCRNPR